MTYNDKLQDIERHFSLWVETFNRQKPDVTTNARKTIEAICRACILKKKGNTMGTQIIFGNYPASPSIPTLRLGHNQSGSLNIQNLIHTISKSQLGIIQDDAIFNQFETIRKLGNSGSHDETHPDQIVTWGDMESCHYTLKPIVNWFFEKVAQTPLPPSIQNALNGNPDPEYISDSDEKWREFYLACESFDKRYQYIFVSPAKLSDAPQTVEAFAKLPWRLVLDFNPKTNSDESGLLYQFHKLKGESKRRVFDIEEKNLGFDQDFPHYWFLANSKVGSPISESSDFAIWRQKYDRNAYLSNKLYHSFNAGSRAKDRIVILFGIGKSYAQSIISRFNDIDEGHIKFILCPTNAESYSDLLGAGYNLELINISADEIAKGANSIYAFNVLTQSDNNSIRIPIKDNTNKSISVKQEDYDYLQSIGIDLVYKGIEERQSHSEPNAFYRGATISWKDLAEQKDVQRTSIPSYKKRVKESLERNSLEVIDLVHEAGAGGTTLARRIAFDFSLEYPTVVLRKYEHKKTIEGLRILINQYTKGSLPLLILLETFEVRNSTELFSELGNDLKKATIIKVTRGKINVVKDKKFTLSANLNVSEISQFSKTFSMLSPIRKEQIDRIPTENPAYISPVLYGITAFGKNYDIRGYILQSIENVSTEHKKLIGFICLIHHFTQKSVPAEAFCSLLGVDRSKCNLNKLLTGTQLLDLLHEEWQNDEPLNEWRPRYSILGERTLKILLGGIDAEDNWKTNLALWIKDFIKYIGQSMPFLNDDVRDVLLALFITRNENTLGGEEEFTDVIRALDTQNGIQIFELLTDTYPDEEAFHAHFARYLYSEKIKIKNYDRAIREAESSLKIQKNSSLVHTLGMCYRKKAENLRKEFEGMGLTTDDAEDEVQRLTEKSVSIFEECIEISPKNVYGYESAIKAILNALEFAFQIHKATNKEDFLNAVANEWYLKYYDKAEIFLEEGLSVLEQSKSLEERDELQKSATYLYDCQSRVFKLSGDHLKAKNKYQDLVKNTPSGRQPLRPLFRRMFITHLLYSKINPKQDIFIAWGKVSQSELVECISYLTENLFDEASNTQNIKLWLQANRHLESPPKIESCLSEISSWRNNTQQSPLLQLEAYYYSYVLRSIQIIEKGFNPFNDLNFVKEMREKISQLPIPKNEKFCFEWYGKGEGIKRMISHKRFKDFKTGFIEHNQDILQEVQGSIKEVKSRQVGTIIMDCGLEAFFVPAHGDFSDRNKGDKVKFFVGFRYDQIQAWTVTSINVEKRDIITDEAFDIPEISVSETTTEETSHQEQAAENQINTENLPGLKVLGKIELPNTQKSTSPPKPLPPTKIKPQEGKEYIGKIKRIHFEVGFIESDLDQDLAFHKSRVSTQDKFENLKKDNDVMFKVYFEKGAPSLDKHGNYKASEVRLIHK